MIGHSLKKEAKEHVCLYLWDYTSNHDESKDGNEKLITKIRDK